MNHSARIFAVNWGIAAALSLCLVGFASAEPPRGGDVQSPRVDGIARESGPVRSSSLEQESLRLGGHYSITLLHRQSVIQCMELVRDAMARKDYLAAVPLMEQVLSEPDSFVPIDAAREVGSHEDVRRTIKKLPVDLRRRLKETHQNAARRAWDLARTRGPAEVAAFLKLFGELPPRSEAWWWLGCHERDHERHQLAAAAFLQVVEHSQANAPRRVNALIAEHDSLMLANCPAEAAMVRERLGKEDRKLAVTVGGRSLPLDDWLIERVAGLSTNAVGDSTVSIELSRSRLRRPVRQPIWKKSFDPPLGAILESREQKQRDQGVRPVQLLRPMIVGDLVIIRTLDSVQAFQIATGECRWTIPNPEVRLQSQWSDDDGYQSKAAEWVQRHSSADSIFGRMSTDGHRLFVIQESVRWGELQIDLGAPRGAVVRTEPWFNKLCCYSVDSGSKVWEIGGNSSDESDAFSRSFFLGSPLVLDNVLYLIAQRDTTIRLMALDAERGALLWLLELGTTLLPIAEDLQRSRIACPIVWHEGLLLCSTSAGAIVAIDPLLRTMKWGYRYSATTIAVGDLQRGPNHQDVFNGHVPWWDYWREPFAAVCRTKTAASTAGQSDSVQDAANTSVLIFASPETDQLHAIQLPDGTPLWTTPRDEGILVAGIDQGLVIIVEGDAVRAHDVATGRMKWRTPTLEISGPGDRVGSFLVLPLQNGGTLLIDVREGTVLSDSSIDELPLGALVASASGWFSYSRKSLSYLPELKDLLQVVEQELLRDPQSEALRLRAASLDLQAGDPLSARKRLDGLQTPTALALRHQSLIDSLRNLDQKSSDSNRLEIGRQLKDMPEDSDHEFISAATMGTAALASGDFVGTVTAALDGLQADPNQVEGLVKAASVNVRKDRLLLGLIEEAYRRATPSEQTALDELFTDRLKAARKRRDRLAVQGLAQQWKGLDWSRRLIVQDDDKSPRKRSLLEAELQLLDAAGSDDRTIAVQALERLAHRFERAGMSADAVAVRQRIVRERTSANSAENSNIADQDNVNAVSSNLKSMKKKTVWPEVEPIVEPPQIQKPFGAYQMIPVHAEPGSLLERLDISIERNGNEVLFRGDSFFQSGQSDDLERKFKLPPTVSPYRGPVGYMLREAWGIGRIVMLLIGTEIFAISPLDENAEPNSRFLWSNPIELQASPGDARVVIARSGVNEGQHFVIDQLNRPIGKIGPVRPGYFCYQKGTKLIAAETETGHTLWERLDLPLKATILGDDHVAFVWRENGTLEILSAIDGRKLEERKWGVSPETMIHQRDALVWTLFHGRTLTLELHDLRTGKIGWTRTVPRDVRIAVLDPETLVIASPEGLLNFVEARSGKPLCEPLKINPTSFTGVLAWSDPDRWFIALTRSLDEASSWKSLKPNESFRRRFVNGTLLGLDRQRPRVLWQRELVDEPIALDQSRAAPVLVQAWKVPSRGNAGVSDGVLRVIDKRTGINLVDRCGEEVSPFFLLNADPQQGILEVKLPREMIRIFYSSPND